MKFRAPAATLVVLLVAAVVGARVYVDQRPTRHRWAWDLLHQWRGDWRAPFDDLRASADGLRIRDSYRRGQVYFETDDAELARSFLDLVQIDEPASGGRCMCSGGTVIDVLRDTGFTVSLRIRHSCALESGALWPGYAQLTSESAEAVCTWLATHGVSIESPLQTAERLAAESKVRDAAQDALIGRERAEALRACEDADVDEAAALIAEWAPDEADRIVLIVRFLTIGDSGDYDGGSRAYTHVYRAFDGTHDPEALAVAFTRLFADEAIASDAAAWFEGIDRYDDGEFPAAALPRLRSIAANRLLASRDEYHQGLGVEVLGRVGDTPEIRARLLGMLPETRDDGSPRSRTTAPQMEAALLVAAFCEPTMLPRLQALAEAGEDRDWWPDRMSERIAERLEDDRSAVDDD